MSYYFSFPQSSIKLISEAKMGPILLLTRCDPLIITKMFESYRLNPVSHLKVTTSECPTTTFHPIQLLKCFLKKWPREKNK